MDRQATESYGEDSGKNHSVRDGNYSAININQNDLIAFFERL